MKTIAAALLFLCTFSFAIAQLPKGDRLLSYSVDNSETQSYEDAFGLAYVNCADMLHLQYPWGAYELDEGEWNTEGMVLMDITNLFYPAYDMPLELNIGTYNTTVNDIPDDLIDVPYNSPEMIDRFKAFLDTMFNRIPDVELTALNIGNESDITIGADFDKYAEYKTFLNEVVPYAKGKYFELHGSELKVGTTLTHSSLIDSFIGSYCQSLNEGLDIVAVTYYPLLEGFQMDEPEVVIAHFQDIVDEYPDTSQPIYFVECGYASSPVCASSDEAQSEFYEHVFTAWDEQYDNIKSVSFFKLSDWSQEDVEIFEEYYDISDEAFLEYLRTLGLRTWPGDGTDKPSWETVKCELQARDWCESAQCTVGIEILSAPSFTVYPNPATLHIQVLVQASHFNGPIVLSDAQGRVVSEYKSNVRYLDISQLPSGYYFVRIGVSTVPFIKE